ncbi:unnamed protein product [Parnassius mnemosyne]|uniref:Centrosomal protein of 192 kDa n=1 Tax=Parnassius mnemosyne TaxID=213953 RepID=A0AAV1KY41_9NEOP
MNNPALTPKKISRLLQYAEDQSFSAKKELPLREEEMKRSDAQEGILNKSNIHFESSSGILDLERVEGFGETAIGAMSLSKSTAFSPGEMTGRSTGTEDIKSHTINLGPAKIDDMFEGYGRHSFALESLTSNLDKQTLEVNDIMRHSIATNYSFHSKRDLTADEASLIIRQAPLPVQQGTQVNITTENVLDSNSNMSMGSYFKDRCPEFSKMLGKTQSPDRPVRPSISEVSLSASSKETNAGNEINNTYKIDQSLDCIPVRQSRGANLDKAVPTKDSIFNMNHTNQTNMHCNYTIPEISVNSCNVDIEQHFKKPYSNKNQASKLYAVQKDMHNRIDQNLLQQRFYQSLNMDQFLKRAHQSHFQIPTEESGASVDNENESSLSISKIADYLGKQSNVSVTGMLQLNNQKKQTNKKQPLTELHMNVQNNRYNNDEVAVTNLKDTKQMDMASSAGTINTVISFDKLKISQEKRDIPAVIITRNSISKNECNNIENKTGAGRSKSPSSKSQSTLSTVQENFTSFKSNDSPLQNSKGEVNLTHIPSPNVEYKELDKSVDWQEVLQQKHLKQESLAKEQWVQIRSPNVNGFVGVSSSVTITITTLADSWLTAKFQFNNLPNEGRDLAIELPRQPLLLSPGKTEQFTLYITSNIEINTTLLFTLLLKDASIDGDIEQNGELEVNFKMPTIQALSCDGMNKLLFPPIQENSTYTKSFVIISDCPVDLQLDLSVIESDSMFTIRNVQEIRKNDVSKALMDRQNFTDEDHHKIGKSKGKVLNKQLCRLTSGNAIKVSITFTAPKLTELDLTENKITCKGALNVNLMGVKSVLKKIDLLGVVGSANLVVEISTNKLCIANEPTTIILRNSGPISGCWMVKLKTIANENIVPFQISPQKFEICPGGEKELNILYTGSQDEVNEAILILEDVVTGKKNTIDITGGTEKPATFPIKTNYITMSWVRAGRKELSLRNSTNKKIQIRCQIVGEGFSIDLPGVESRGIYCVAFGPQDCRSLPIVFAPSSTAPHVAALHLVYDKNSDFSRKVKLFGCSSGECVRWSGLVTYGDTALLRAATRAPLSLPLYNKYSVPAFVAATVHFNLQYRWCAEGSQLEGARRVVCARSRHALRLRVDWARVERRARALAASALAALTVLTGPELTRRRILRIIRNKSTGELDTSLLPDHLKILAEEFEGQEIVSDECLKDFEETTSSLNELIESLQELNAQIDLPQDFADENTIIISDDTVLEHHTLCD